VAGKLPKEFAEVHKILGRAMRAVDQSLWPARPHLGGQLPVLTTGSQLGVGIAICDAMRGYAGKDELAAFDKRAAAARKVDDGKRIPHKDLDAISRSAKSDPVATRVSKLAARAALNHLYAAPSARNVVGTCVENAAVAAVRYHTDRGAADDARAFLRFVDNAVLASELRTALRERSFEPSSPIAEVVSRPRGTTKSLALVLARLADGNFGLFVKLKQRWQWHEGDRDTMFATVPDEFMRLVMADIDPGFKRTQA
jgi:hypothetical protein